MLRCSVKACPDQAEHRVVVLARGVFAGAPVRVRLELPFFACAAHSHPGALWAGVLRTVPRAFAALLGHVGVGVPWRHTRIRFVQVGASGRRRPAAPARTPAEVVPAIATSSA